MCHQSIATKQKADLNTALGFARIHRLCTEVCCARRGMAKFEEGLPWEEKDAFRFIYGAQEGLVGVYPVSTNEIFYFCAFPASRVRAAHSKAC